MRAPVERAYKNDQKWIAAFRAETYAKAFGVSLVILAVLPVLALAAYLIGLLLYTIVYGVWFGMYASIVVCGLLLVGLLMSAPQNGNQEPNQAAGCGCTTFIILACWLFPIFSSCQSDVYSMSHYCIAQGSACSNVLLKTFSDWKVVYWCWAPAVFAGLYGVFSSGSLGAGLLLERIRRLRGIRYICPWLNCGHSGLPAFQCPNCDTYVSELTPSLYGIFSVPCPHCGRPLRTSGFWGRNLYKKLCPHCNQTLEISGLGEYPERKVVLAGASKCGKTSFLIRTTVQWRSGYRSRAQFGIEKQETILTAQESSLGLSHPCPPTPSAAYPEAVPMIVSQFYKPKLIYFYDSDGNEFDDNATVLVEPYYQGADGIILFIDPFAERGVLQALNLSVDELPKGWDTSNEPADAIASKLCLELERIEGTGPEVKFTIPLCVVLTKTDAYDLYNEIDPDGLPQVTRRARRDYSQWNAHDLRVRQFLERVGMHNFVSIIDSRFEKVDYFASSAYGNPRTRLAPATLPPVVSLIQRIEERSSY